jgi:glucose-6-phosphate dehydrogenase assembly protein OpcA
MALTYKVLGQSAPAATTQTDIYTSPASTATIVNGITICNTGSSQATFRVAVRVGGATLTSAMYVAYEVPINGTSTTELALGITLGAADVITVYSSSGTLSFSAFGVQIV